MAWRRWRRRRREGVGREGRSSGCSGPMLGTGVRTARAAVLGGGARARCHRCCCCNHRRLWRVHDPLAPIMVEDQKQGYMRSEKQGAGAISEEYKDTSKQCWVYANTTGTVHRRTTSSTHRKRRPIVYPNKSCVLVQKAFLHVMEHIADGFTASFGFEVHLRRPRSMTGCSGRHTLGWQACA